jgi:hypothetical protein
MSLQALRVAYRTSATLRQRSIQSAFVLHRNPAKFQRTCAPPEDERLVDNCIDKGDGYKKVEEPVRLDAGDVGER